MTFDRSTLAQGRPFTGLRLASLALARFALARVALAAAASALAACNGRTFEVPVPAVQAAGPPIPPAEPATIALPIILSMSAVRTPLDSAFPAADSLDRAQCSALAGLVCHHYVYARDSLDVRMQGDRFSLATRLRYRARVALPRVGSLASCGYDEPMRGAELRFATSLYWRTDWRLASRGTTLEARLLDPCRVTVLDVNATPLMQRIVDGQLRDLIRQVDSIIPVAADVRPAADSLWRAMQAPVALDSTNTVWLVMAPDSVRLAALAGTGDAASTAIVFSARPRVVVGAKPQTTARPLPSLALAHPANGFRVPLDIELPFAELSQKVTALLAQQTATQNPRVTDVKVWGVGDTAVIKVGVAGKVTGSFYLLGRVAFDSTARTVLISDLRYTLASSDAMTRLKATLGAPLIKRAVDEATGRGRLDVGAQLDQARDLLTRQLNGPLAPGITSVGHVDDVRILGLYTTQTGFVLRVVLRGEARMEVR